MKTALNGFSNYIIYLEFLNTSHKREVKATKQLLHLFSPCYWICTFIGVTQVLHVCTTGYSVPELLHIELHCVHISSIYKPSKIGLWRNSDSGNYGLLEKTTELSMFQFTRPNLDAVNRIWKSSHFFPLPLLQFALYLYQEVLLQCAYSIDTDFVIISSIFKINVEVRWVSAVLWNSYPYCTGHNALLTDHL